MNIGDRVNFLDEQGSGLIVEIYNNIVTIENEYGFLEKRNKNELVLQNMETSTIKEVLIKDNTNQKKEKQKHDKERIIDLHFGHLVDYPNKYTAQQKLNIQLKEVYKSIEEARKDKLEKLILIHGKGKGVLEMEIHKILSKMKKIEFYDADFKRYKLGAVEIKFI